MEKLNLDKINNSENQNSKEKEQESTEILKCLEEECGIDVSLLTEEDLKIYKNFKEGKLSVDYFRVYRNKIISEANDISGDRKEFLAHIASKVMIDYLRKDVSVDDQA